MKKREREIPPIYIIHRIGSVTHIEKKWENEETDKKYYANRSSTLIEWMNE